MLPLVDDFLFLAPSREIALRRLRAMVDRMWGCLGLARHPTKAHPEPTQRLQHMGPEIDLTEMRFYGPPDCHARPRPALPRCPPPPPSGRAPATYFLSATLKPRSVASYCSSELSLFMDFYALEGASPLDEDTPFIVRYISWAAKRGRNKAGAFQPYLSAVNTLFFRDHLREAVALGPLINQAVCDPKLALVDTRVAGIRVPLPADVALRCMRRAQALRDSPNRDCVVHTYIVPGILDSAGGRFFFSFLTPAGLSAGAVIYSPPTVRS
eukprot:jgi/Tetstr1/439656/TSEL_028077.t1